MAQTIWHDIDIKGWHENIDTTTAASNSPFDLTHPTLLLSPSHLHSLSLSVGSLIYARVGTRCVVVRVSALTDAQRIQTRWTMTTPATQDNTDAAASATLGLAFDTPINTSLSLQIATPSVRPSDLKTAKYIVLRPRTESGESSLHLHRSFDLLTLLPLFMHGSVLTVGSVLHLPFPSSLSPSASAGGEMEVVSITLYNADGPTDSTSPSLGTTFGLIDSKRTVLAFDEYRHDGISHHPSSLLDDIAFPETPEVWIERIRHRVYGYQNIVEEMVDTMWNSVQEWKEDCKRFHHSSLHASSSTPPPVYLSSFGPRSFLLTGLSGSGKTHLARTLAGTSGLPWFFYSAASLLQRREGDSELGLVKMFERARQCHKRPTWIVIDEIDAILPKDKSDGAGEEGGDEEGGGGGIGASMKRAASNGWILGNRRLEWRMASVLKQLLKEVNDIPITNGGSVSVGGSSSTPPPTPPIFFLFTTTTPAALDACGFRQAPYIDQEIQLRALTRQERKEGLEMSMRKMRFEEEDRIESITDEKEQKDLTTTSTNTTNPRRDAILTRLASSLHGYVCADLDGFVRELWLTALRRYEGTVNKSVKVRIGSQDLKYVLERFRPSNMQALEFRVPQTMIEDEKAGESIDGTPMPAPIDPNSMTPVPFSAVAHHFSSLAGIDPILSHLHSAFLLPLLQPRLYLEYWQHHFGMNSSKGVLLYGPSGIGKTHLSMCLAKACGLNVIILPATSLVNKVLGSAEATLSKIFARARASAPCLLILDQVENVAPKRKGLVQKDDEHDDHDDQHEADVYERILSVLLVEMDGVMGKSSSSSNEQQVYLLATSTRPDHIDPALLRPGRIDTHLCLPIPNMSSRYAILELLFKPTLIYVETDEEGRIFVPKEWSLTYLILMEEEREKIQQVSWSYKVETPTSSTSNVRSPSDSRLRSLFLRLVAHVTPHFSGADLVSLHRECCMHALRRSLSSTCVESWNDLFVGSLKYQRGTLEGVEVRHPFGQHMKTMWSMEIKRDGEENLHAVGDGNGGIVDGVVGSGLIFKKKTKEEVLERNMRTNAMARRNMPSFVIQNETTPFSLPLAIDGDDDAAGQLDLSAPFVFDDSLPVPSSDSSSSPFFFTPPDAAAGGESTTTFSFQPQLTFTMGSIATTGGGAIDTLKHAEPTTKDATNKDKRKTVKER